MSILVQISHRSDYRFDRPINLAPHEVRLRPFPCWRTPIHDYSIKIEPVEHYLCWQQDCFGNHVARIVFPEKCTSLLVEVSMVADIVAIDPFDFFLEENAFTYPFDYEPRLRNALSAYLHVNEAGPLLKQWLKTVDCTPRETVYFLHDLNGHLHETVQNVVRMGSEIQTVEESLALGQGRASEIACIMVQALRHLGLAARFVSGYLVQLQKEGEALDDAAGPENDSIDYYAWVEVFLPGAGWIGLDPAFGLFANESHIPLAAGPDASDARPIIGSIDRCGVEFSFQTEIRRIQGSALVAKAGGDDQLPGDIMLICAAQHGNGEAVGRMIEKGLDPNIRDEKQMTALMYASQEGFVQIAQALLDHGADVDAIDKNGKTALMFAAHAGNTEIARLLLSNGADARAQDNRGMTALAAGATEGHRDVVTLLLSMCAHG